MTDDIEMAGAGAESNVGQRAVRAIEAGADMVMIAWSRKIQREVTTALADAVDSGRLKRSRVEDALRRIARAKSVYVPEVLKLATKEELTRSFKNPDFTMLGEAVLRSAARNLEERRTSATAIASAARVPSAEPSLDTGFDAAGDPMTAPSGVATEEPAARESVAQERLSAPAKLKPGNDPIIVLSARADFLTTFKERAAGFNVKLAVLKPSRKEAVERLLRANPESPVFVYVSGRQVASFVSELDDTLTAKMILINIETKASITRPDRFRDIFEVHYRHPELGNTVAESYLDLASQKRVPSIQLATERK